MQRTHYIRSKIKSLRAEYRRDDAQQIIKAAGSKCSICGRKDGDNAVFGPTHYLKKQISFKVKVHIHVIHSDDNIIPCVLDDFCHLNYHLFNRLDRHADFGGKKLKDTIYRD